MSERRKMENREYRSDVFSMLMKRTDYALDVYNALNNSEYTDPELIELKTLEHGISLTIRNDAAFIIKADLNIYEHQSTYNPNMPLRSLIYFTDIIKELLKGKDLYGNKLINIPRPQFVVFYNGAKERPEVEIQRLSDAYEHDENVSLELICTAYNINPNKNDGLKKKSYVLDGYTIFVEKVKENIANKDEYAVSHAIKYCIENNILKDFFEQMKDEVLRAMTIDMTFERRIELTAKESYDDGKQEGIELGKQEGIELGIQFNLITAIKKKCSKGKNLETIADELEENIETIKVYYDIIQQNEDLTLAEIYQKSISE